MKIKRLERSRHQQGRILAFLDNGSCLKLTEQELLDFGLRAGDELTEETLERLRISAGSSQVRAQAAALIGRRAMSRRDLESKLRDKGASEEEACRAAEWLEAIGALNDADYAAALVRRCADMGYGAAHCREELYRHGISRELWEEALEEAAAPEARLDAFLQKKLRGARPEEKEKRRLTAALLRRGFSWEEVRGAWRRYGERMEEEEWS